MVISFKKFIFKNTRRAPALFLLSLFVFQIAMSSIPGQAAAERLPDAELKALTQYPNWVADPCADSGGGNDSSTVSLDGETTGPPEAVQKVVWATLKNAGIDDIHTAAVLGNLYSEGSDPLNAGYYPDNIRTKDPTHPKAEDGYGLMAWTPGTRLTDSMKEAGIEGKPYTAETQAAVIVAHIKGKTPSQYPASVGQNFLATKNIAAATTAFQGTASEKGFENPGDTTASLDKRISTAKEMLEKYRGSAIELPSNSVNVTINGPFKGKARPNDTVKKGDAYKGNASVYGNDPQTGYQDPSDNNQPALSGASNNDPGIAVYNRGTLGGWWKVIAPNGKSAILRQTDYGPSTARTVDINAVAARAVFDYNAKAFPTNKGDWKIEYAGKSKPDGAIEKASDATNTPEESATSTEEQIMCCGDGSTSEGSVTLSGSGNEEKIYNYFISKGLEPFQAAGILGNVQTESAGTFDPQIVQGGSKSKNPDDAGEGGYGIFQFTPGSKLKEIMNAAGIKGEPYELVNQLEAVWAQLSGKAGSYNETQAMEELKKTKNVHDATAAFMGAGDYFGYERPADQSEEALQPRAAAARGFLTKFGGGSAAGAVASSSADECCPPGAAGSVDGGSPSDWVKMYTGANASKAAGMGHGKVNPKILVIHYTVGPQEGQSLLNFFAGEETGIQFNVGKTGKVYQYFPLKNMQETYHALGANSKSIGIEITGRDVDELMGNDKQFQAVAGLATFLCDYYSIPCSEPKGDITGDGIGTAQGMLGHDETPTNDHMDPDAKYGKTVNRRDSSKHPYMMKLREAMGFDKTPGRGGGSSGSGASSSSSSSGSSGANCVDPDAATGNGTKKDPVGEGPNRALALEAVQYDTKTNNNKYTYEMGGLHGPLSELKNFAQNGGVTDCSGFVRYIIWKVYGNDIGSFVTQSVPSMGSVFKEVKPSEVAAGDIGWRSEHVDFITENKGGGKIHQFGAHSSANDLYGGDDSASSYTKFYRYIGPKGGHL